MISLASKESAKSHCRCKHGSVISRGGSVLGKGYNTYKSHPVWGSGPLLAVHAEASAIRSAVRRGISLKGSTIYVTRTGHVSQMSRPCVSCQQLIEEYGIRKVVYTDKDGNILIEYPL